MEIYEVLILDDRYSVPSLVLIDVEDEAHARMAAERCLRESPHHYGVEVRRHGQLIFDLPSRHSSGHNQPTPAH
ncbi:MAG TPA: hypothetical protein VN814_10065 [Caulobacteraceae bacterium]|nr:hypothetical protein [Caulobacteraceae bacterium]